MKIIYCDNVFEHNIIEPDYEAEKKAAIQIGFGFSLLSLEEFSAGNTISALRHVKTSQTKELAIYRGWILTSGQYKNLKENIR
jgi:hypothetical protein